MLRLKISLLATFVLFTLLGMAASSLEALLIGLGALVGALLIAVANVLRAEHQPQAGLPSSR